MRWGFVTSLLVLFSVLEGTLLQVFRVNAWEGSFYILPRFVLVLLIFISLYVGRRSVLILGAIFGVLLDIQYSGVIGVYAFSLGCIPYLTGLAYQYFQLNVVLTIATVFLSVYVQEGVTYFLYDLFGLIDGHFDLLTHLPTAAFNALFALVLYKPITHFLVRMTLGRSKNEGI